MLICSVLFKIRLKVWPPIAFRTFSLA